MNKLPRNSLGRLALVAAMLALAGAAGCETPRPRLPERLDSGGPLLHWQAAYDVVFYDLAVEVLPDSRTIRGTVEVKARIRSPLDVFLLDLDPALEVESAALLEDDGRRPLAFDHRRGRLWIDLPETMPPGVEVSVEIRYGGKPREAPNAPWAGGFVWEETPSGAPWIATACQGEGADLWWPVKDHVSDEPEGMAIRITVPKPLVAASNGALERVERLDDGRRTYHWKVSTPINAYNVALNIAPYRRIERSYASVSGESFPAVFYVLPEDLERAEEAFSEFLDHLRFHEELLGPYPFRADKYGVAQTPYLGMEHQTIIAYGAGFERGAMTRGADWGFDVLHHHELSHEWWGNLVTNTDWSDFWIHEGFGTYMQALYLERTQGEERYLAYLESLRRRIRNRQPVAPRDSLSTGEAYSIDIYFKGAWILHTLRYFLGDEPFFRALRRMAYPDPALELITDGRQCRFATTEDFLRIAEAESGRELDWFFEVYLRRAALPRLRVERSADRIELSWETPDDLPFRMPIDVEIEGEVQRVDVPGVLDVAAGAEAVIDPRHRVLRAE